MGKIITPKWQVRLAGIITLFGLGGLGLLLIYWFHKDVFSGHFIVAIPNILYQIGIGTLYAIASAIILLLLLRMKMLSAARSFFGNLIKRFNISLAEIFYLSLCAGIGEEILFRGALQPWLGIWLTALLFIALHGYLNPKNRPLFIYGIVLMIISAGLGYLAQIIGLYSAITAHFWIDVALMLYLKRSIYAENS